MLKLLPADNVINAPITTAMRLLYKHDPEPQHASHVAGLAMQIFKQITHQKTIKAEFSDILHVAALLHDVGHAFSPDGKDHHIYSEKFILSQTWPGWDTVTVRICARVARLHRKKITCDDMLIDTTLRDEAIPDLLVLAAILRVADALDRSHTQTVRSVKLTRTGDVWHLQSAPHPTGPEELYGLGKKSDLWQQTLGTLTWP